MSRFPFWSDDFDMDLYKILPDAEKIIAPVADVALYTRGHETFGRLNHPATWGISAYFGLDQGQTHFPEYDPQPDSYSAGDPIIRCTWEEACRDVWAHSLYIHLRAPNGSGFWPLWNAHALTEPFMRLMYDLRGWHAMEEELRRLDHRRCLETLLSACQKLKRIVGSLS